MGLAAKGVMAHYLDVNFSLVPDYILSELHKEDELPVRIYRPGEPTQAEKVLEILASETLTHPELIILDSLILMGRVALLRDLEVDPVYVFALMRKFALKPQKRAVVILETRMRNVSQASVVKQFTKHIDFIAKSAMVAGGALSISVSHTPFTDVKLCRIEASDLPTALL